MKKKVLNVGVILFATSIMLYFTVFKRGIGFWKNEMRTLNFKWLLLAFFAMFMYWGIESITLNVFTKFTYSKQSFKEAFKITMVGQFFNSVTPFASGGQPAQLYFMIKKGIKGGTASSILTMKLIVYQIVLITYSLLAIILKFTFFKENLPNFFYVSFIGFFLNVVAILLLFSIFINKNITKGILKGVLKFLNKIHLVKNLKKYRLKFEEEIDNFHENAVEISKNFKVVLKSIVLTFVQLTAYFVIPYFIYRAFNMSSANFWSMVAAETFLNMIVAVIPLPGAAGGSEGGFYLLFGLFFNKATIMPAIFLWRVITYYSCIAVGSMFLGRGRAESSLQ